VNDGAMEGDEVMDRHISWRLQEQKRLVIHGYAARDSEAYYGNDESLYERYSHQKENSWCNSKMYKLRRMIGS
jgi:hypothetical protein